MSTLLPEPDCTEAEAQKWLEDHKYLVKNGFADPLTDQDLRDLLARVSANSAPDAPGAIFYSGSKPYNANKTANSLYSATGEQLAIIDESPFARFIQSSQFSDAYRSIHPDVDKFVWETDPAFNDTVWEAASARYADAVSGPVIALLPDGALPQRVFGSTELLHLLDNDDVDSINGVSRESLAQEFDIYRQHALDVGATMDEAIAAARDALVEERIKPSSNHLLQLLGGVDADGDPLLVLPTAEEKNVSGVQFTTPYAGVEKIGVHLQDATPDGMSLDQALRELEDLGPHPTADQLRDLVDRTSTGLEVDRDGSALRLGQRYYVIDPDGTVRLIDASVIAEAADPSVITLHDTTMGRLIDSPQFESALTHVFGSSFSPEALEFLGFRQLGSSGGTPGVLDGVDSAMVTGHRGDIIFVALDTSANNAITTSLLESARDNPLIDRVNGIRTGVAAALATHGPTSSQHGSVGVGSSATDFATHVLVASGQQHPEVTLNPKYAGSHALTNAASLIGSATVLHALGVVGDAIDYGLLAWDVGHRIADGDYAGASESVRNWSAGTAAGILGSMGALAMGGLLLGTGPVGGLAIVLALAGGAAGAVILGESFHDALEGLTDWIADLMGIGDGDGLPDWLDPSGAFDNPPIVRIDPLVLDLDGDGVELIGLAESRAQFDLDGNGLAERTAWVRPDDALLARDLDGDGRIDDISELFGSRDVDGFTELAELDGNGDGVIDTADAAFGDLRLWRDLDGDGAVDAGELSTLSEQGVASIDLGAGRVSEWTEATWTSHRGSFTRVDGSTSDVDEIWFATDQLRTTSRADEAPAGGSSDPDLMALPNLVGYGTVPDLTTAVSRDPALAAALTELVRQSLTAPTAETRQALEHLILTWADAADAATGSRGAAVDARHLAFLEAVNGRPWLNSTSTVPDARQGAGLEDYYQEVMGSFVSKLAVQLPLAAAALTGDPSAADAHPLADLTLFAYNAERDRLVPVPALAAAGLLADLGGGQDGALRAADTIALFDEFEVSAPDGGAFGPYLVDQLGRFGAGIAQRELAARLVSGAELVVGDGRLTGTGEGEVLMGGAGQDLLLGTGGADLFDGGAGDDTMSGGASDDVYLWRPGSGDDTIRDAGGRDRLVLDGVRPDQVSLHREGVGALRLEIAESAPGAGDGGSVTIDSNGRPSVEQVQFDDGTVWDIDRTRVFDPSGEDRVIGLDGTNVYLWSRGDGNLSVQDDPSGVHATGTLILDSVDSSRVTVRRGGEQGDIAELVVAESAPGAGDDAVVRLIGTFDDDDPTGGLETIVLDDVTWTRDELRSHYLAQSESSTDLITGFDGRADVFRGGAGDDLLIGGEGDNTYRWARGDGDDTVIDGSLDGTGTLVLEGIRQDQVHLGRIDDDVLVRIDESAPGAGDGAVLTLAGTFGQHGAGLDRIELTDASWDLETLRSRYLAAGDATADTIVGFADQDDWIIGGPGDDHLVGNGGRNLFLWSPGDGNDTIADHSRDGVHDTLMLTGVSSDRVQLTAEGNDVLLAIADSRPGAADGATLRLTGVLGDTNDHRGVDEVVLDDDVWTREQLTACRPTADSTTPAGDRDPIPVDPGTTVLDWRRMTNWVVSNDGALDTLVLTGVSSGRVTVDRSAQDVGVVRLIVAPSGPGSGDGGVVQIQSRGAAADTLGGFRTVVFDGTTWQVADSPERPATPAAPVLDTTEPEIVDGPAENDHEGSAPSPIGGGRGDDLLTGDDRNNTFVWARGDGDDIIDGGHGADVLLLTDVRPEDVVLSRQGDTIVVTILPMSSAANDGATILLALSVGGDRGVESIVFDDGTVWDRLPEQLDGPGAGHDIVQIGHTDGDADGLSGDDTYVWRRGDGDGTVIDTSASDEDTLVLRGVRSDQVTIVQDGTSGRAVVTIAESAPGAGDGGSLILDGTLRTSANGRYGVDSIEFTDTIWDRAAIRAHYLAQAATDGDDTIRGFDVADTIRGGRGDDVLDGFGGNDTYIWARGDGNDRFVDGYYQDTDTLILEGVRSDQIRITRDGTAAVLTIAESGPGAGDGATLRLSDSLNPSWKYGVDRLVLSDATWDRARIRAEYLATAGTAGNDTIKGFNASADVLRGGLGNDVLDGFGGNDTYVWARGDGDDTIIDGYSTDVDRLRLVQVSSDQVTVTRDGTAAIVTIAESSPGAQDGGVLRLADSLNTTGKYGVDVIQFDDVVWDRGTMQAHEVAVAEPLLLDGVSAAGMSGDDDFIIADLPGLVPEVTSMPVSGASLYVPVLETDDLAAALVAVEWPVPEATSTGGGDGLEPDADSADPMLEFRYS